MKLLDYLKPAAILPNIAAKTKTSAIRELVSLLKHELNGIEVDTVVATILERETIGSTYIGNAIAIPHGRVEGIKNLLTAFGRVTHEIDFDTPDEEPVRFIYLLISPYNSVGIHLRALAKITKMFKDQQLIASLERAHSRDEIYQLLLQADQAATAAPPPLDDPGLPNPGE